MTSESSLVISSHLTMSPMSLLFASFIVFAAVFYQHFFKSTLNALLSRLSNQFVPFFTRLIMPATNADAVVLIASLRNELKVDDVLSDDTLA